MYVKVTQVCLTVCNPVNCSPIANSVYGIFQARILEWVAISFSRGIFPAQVSLIAARLFTVWATREAHNERREKRNKIDFEE